MQSANRHSPSEILFCRTAREISLRQPHTSNVPRPQEVSPHARNSHEEGQESLPELLRVFLRGTSRPQASLKACRPSQEIRNARNPHHQLSLISSIRFQRYRRNESLTLSCQNGKFSRLIPNTYGACSPIRQGRQVPSRAGRVWPFSAETKGTGIPITPEYRSPQRKTH